MLFSIQSFVNYHIYLITRQNLCINSSLIYIFLKMRTCVRDRLFRKPHYNFQYKVTKNKSFLKYLNNGFALAFSNNTSSSYTLLLYSTIN